MSEECSVTEAGRNARRVVCRHCACVVLLADAAILQQFDKPLPAEKGDSERRMHARWWSVAEMYTFHNIGFSNTVESAKFLVCADCERGPIGYQDLDSKVCYVSAECVAYAD